MDKLSDNQINSHNLKDSQDFLFSRETLESLCELGEVLRKIHARMISEGYEIFDGKIKKSDKINLCK